MRLIRHYIKYLNYLGFRNGPVPYTGQSKAYGPYYRSLRTNNERKFSADPTIKQYVRAKRNFVNIPNSWDDYIVSKQKDRCWKRTKKKKQWM